MPLQGTPSTPAERRAQAETRKRWLDEWTGRVVADEGRVPTMVRAREALRTEFGRTLANEDLARRLGRWRTVEGEESVPEPVLPRGVRQLVEMMRAAHITAVRLDGAWAEITTRVRVGRSRAHKQPRAGIESIS